MLNKHVYLYYQKILTMENTPQIFDKQVITHSKALYPFAYNLTKNVDDAQDLIQETMYRSLVNKEKFAEGTNLRAWLFTIMRHYKGFKYHEIAKELDLPLGTVKSRIFFARKELQKRITRY